ncbi:ketopantoate reductase family protein [Nitrosophilus alvini]|uniref:ketopantoate reductase family protein n=1 Tax=Nitrosophilus alvini TaxID=2714855 RepID=UPI0019091623|nr:2-dehydropantoate 2-reductase [Nitrosophilus alvini]
MKIAVVGIGGVGGYVGSKLGRIAEVDFITPHPENFKNGIKIIENGKKNSCHPANIYKTPPENIIYDAVIFAVKSYSLEEAAKNIEKNVSKNTIIIPLLNGVEPYEILKNIFPDSNVAKGAIYIISNKTAKDEITLKGKGAYTVFGKNDEIKSLEWLKDIFEKAGIKTKLTKDIDKEIWKKYLFIAATAALTTYYKKSFGQIAKENKKEFEEILDEIIQIANQKGIPLDKADKKRAVELLEKSPYEAKSSMQLDFENRKPAEIENILGYIIKAKKGDKTPLLDKIYNELKNS